MPRAEIVLQRLCIMYQQAVILLAEDSQDDILLIRRAFRQANIINPLQVVRDGEEVIAYLSGDGRYANRAEYPLPELLLLDLKMPGLDGFDVLRWIRDQPGLQAMRIVVLSSSQQIRDVNLAYRLGANSFLVKPVDFKDLVELTQAIQGYWLWLSKTPESFRPTEQSQPEPEKNKG